MVIANPRVDGMARGPKFQMLHCLAKCQIGKSSMGSELNEATRLYGFHKPECKWAMFVPRGLKQVHRHQERRRTYAPSDISRRKRKIQVIPHLKAVQHIGLPSAGCGDRLPRHTFRLHEGSEQNRSCVVASAPMPGFWHSRGSIMPTSWS